MSKLSKTSCDASVVQLNFKYSPIPQCRPPNFCLCQSEMPSIFQTEGRWGWRWACQQWQYLAVEHPWSRPWIGHEHGMLISACDTVTGQADRQRLYCLCTQLWMSFKNRQVQESGRGGERCSLFLSSYWQVKDSFFFAWSLLHFSANFHCHHSSYTLPKQR